MNSSPAQEPALLVPTEWLDRFPGDPIHVPAVPAGMSYNDVVAQRAENLKRMQDLGEQFTGASQDLVRQAAYLSMLCHFNQSEGSPGSTHYSNRVLEGAERVDRNFTPSAFAEKVLDPQGQSLEQKAVAISVALLRDTLKNFGDNFRGSPSEFKPGEESLSMMIARERVLHGLRYVLPEQQAQSVIKMVEKLSNRNDDGFPSMDEIEEIRDCAYCTAVKLADLDLALPNIPAQDPLWGSLVVAAKFRELVRSSAYQEAYQDSVLRSVAALDLNDQRTASRIAEIVSLFREKDGAEGLEALTTSVSELANMARDAEFSSHLAAVDLSEAKILAFQKAVTDVICPPTGTTQAIAA